MANPVVVKVSSRLHIVHLVSQVAIAVIKHHVQRQLGEDRVYLAYRTIIKRSWVGTQGQARRQKPWNAVYWLAFRLLCPYSFTYKSQAHLPRDGTDHHHRHID